MEIRHCALDQASVILRDDSQSLDSVQNADSMLIPLCFSLLKATTPCYTMLVFVVYT